MTTSHSLNEHRISHNVTLPHFTVPAPDPLAAVKAAYAAGKTVQYRRIASTNPWSDFGTHQEDKTAALDYVMRSIVFEWRVKPEPRYVALEPKDVPPGTVLGYADQWCLVTCVTTDGFQMGQKQGGLATVSWEEARRLYRINRSLPLTGKWDATAWEKCEKPEQP